MKRLIFLACGGAAVFVSYLAAIVAPSNTAIGDATVARILLPGLVSGLVMIAYIAWEARSFSRVKGMNDELSAQLVRKEIEIGRLATVDELTGLYTRREFEETVRLEFERTRRHGRDVALVLVEIDDIAALGERVGAVSRGYLVSEVSSILRSVLRANDFGARYTNDCLALLLPETGEDGAQNVTEKVAEAISRHRFLGQLGDSELRLTVAQGIAVAEPWMKSAEELMRGAEGALVDARAGGYSQTVVYHRDGAAQPAATRDTLDLAS